MGGQGDGCGGQKEQVRGTGRGQVGDRGDRGQLWGQLGGGGGQVGERGQTTCCVYTCVCVCVSTLCFSPSTSNTEMQSFL